MVQAPGAAQPPPPELDSVVRVFLGSPGGLDAERAVVARVVESLNEMLATHEARIELLSGDNHGPAGGRPQDDINRDVDRCRIFIGLLWDEWGHPTGSYESGFEEEYARVAARRDANGGWPQPLLWFKALDPRRRADPGKQLEKVLAFRARLEEEQDDFYREFTDASDLEEQVRPRLYEEVAKLIGLRAPSPLSLHGIQEDDQPPRVGATAPPEPRPTAVDFGQALTAGPLQSVPDGEERYRRALEQREERAIESADTLLALGDELQAQEGLGPAAEHLRAEAAPLLAEAGQLDRAVNALLSALRPRLRRGSELAAYDARRLADWLPADQRWIAAAWEACASWPESFEDAAAALTEALDRAGEETSQDDRLLWARQLAELQLLSGSPDAALATVDRHAGDGIESGDTLMLALLGADAQEAAEGPASAKQRWAQLLQWVERDGAADPRGRATVHARVGVSRTRREDMDGAVDAFAAAALAWGEVADAQDQVAEAYFSAQSARQLLGEFAPSSFEWRPLAVSMRGSGDSPDAVAGRLEKRGLEARVIGKLFDARRAMWLALAENARAGNLRGQLLGWHLLGELHEHSGHHALAVAAYVSCGRVKDAADAARQGDPDEVLPGLVQDGPTWERAASLAVLGAIGRRLDAEQAAELVGWVLDENAATVSDVASRVAGPAAEALAAIAMALPEALRESAVAELRRLVRIQNLLICRPAAEALMLLTNAQLSDESSTIVDAFATPGDLAAISSVWVGDRLSRRPDLVAPVRAMALEGRRLALEALAVAGAVGGDDELQAVVDDYAQMVLDSRLGADKETGQVGIASFEGIGIVAREASSRDVRAAVGNALARLVGSDDEPQINRVSAANALFNLARGLDGDHASALAERLIPVANGELRRSAWDMPSRDVKDPFNRFRLGFAAAAGELRAAALSAAAALTSEAGNLPGDLPPSVAAAEVSAEPVIAAAAWDSRARNGKLRFPRRSRARFFITRPPCGSPRFGAGRTGVPSPLVRRS